MLDVQIHHFIACVDTTVECSDIFVQDNGTWGDSDILVSVAEVLMLTCIIFVQLYMSGKDYYTFVIQTNPPGPDLSLEWTLLF